MTSASRAMDATRRVLRLFDARVTIRARTERRRRHRARPAERAALCVREMFTPEALSLAEGLVSPAYIAQGSQATSAA